MRGKGSGGPTASASASGSPWQLHPTSRAMPRNCYISSLRGGRRAAAAPSRRSTSLRRIRGLCDARHLPSSQSRSASSSAAPKISGWAAEFRREVTPDSQPGSHRMPAWAVALLRPPAGTTAAPRAVREPSFAVRIQDTADRSHGAPSTRSRCMAGRASSRNPSSAASGSPLQPCATHLSSLVDAEKGVGHSEGRNPRRVASRGGLVRQPLAVP